MVLIVSVWKVTKICLPIAEIIQNLQQKWQEKITLYAQVGKLVMEYDVFENKTPFQ